MDTVGKWLEAMDAEGELLSESKEESDTNLWWRQRLERQHGLQISLDVIAHAQNFPLRLLRKKNLSNLDDTFEKMVRERKELVQTILRENGPKGARDAARDGIGSLLEKKNVNLLKIWVLSLGTDKPQTRPKELPDHYESWFLELLPHLERQIWLTDMSNSHPAHSLARMVEHWSLYILMWVWENEKKFESLNPKVDNPRFFEQAIEIERFAITTQKAFVRDGMKDTSHEVWILGGPFEIEPGHSNDKVVDAHLVDPHEHWFNKTFSLFVANASRFVMAWSDITDKAPNATELFDAFATRPPLNKEEALRRALEAKKAIDELRSAKLHPSVQNWLDRAGPRPISRANWETIAALATWLARWSPRIEKMRSHGGGIKLWNRNIWPRVNSEHNQSMHIFMEGHRLSIVVDWNVENVKSSDIKARTVTIIDKRFEDTKKLVADTINIPDVVREANKVFPDQWIDTPSAFFSRARERQHALWTSHIGAIGNLLMRHSRRDRPIGPDNFEEPKYQDECDEVDHLLRGYANRICQYILQIARADAALITWLDYSENPPQLRHIGSADRLIQHRAERNKRYRKFCEWSRETLPGDASIGSPNLAGAESPSQLYRSIATAEVEPRAKSRRATNADETQVKDKYLDHYSLPKPVDAMAIPLLFNGRVVGAFTICGISSYRQFNQWLHQPLRLVAQQLAQAIATQSQLWQMRRLNWLASHIPLEEWRKHDEENNYNPLERVAKIFANIFLGPVVFIWLRDQQNANRFRLHGYTHGEILHGAHRKLLSPYFFNVEPLDANCRAPLSRQFSAFALEILNNKELDGSFVQGRYSNENKETEYCLENARQGTLVLYNDFVMEPNALSFRKRLFEKNDQCMAFPLVDASDHEKIPVGIVSIHAPSPARIFHPTSTNTPQSTPWPADWRPFIAHIQTYLPYVLLQTEAIANPIYHMRQYLLHEGRNELNAVSARATALNELLEKLIAIDRPRGQIRPWLRESIADLEKFFRTPSPTKFDLEWLKTAMAELSRFDSLLKQLPQNLDELVKMSRAENLGILARLIEGNQDLKILGDPNTSKNFSHKTKWFSLGSKLSSDFGVFRGLWKQIGREPDISKDLDSVEILTSEPMWNVMTRDLVHNIAKYAIRNEPIKVEWQDLPGQKLAYLRISNVSSYDPKLDRADRLGKFGVKGSAGSSPPRDLFAIQGVQPKGQGMGLWGAIAIAKALGMVLKPTIVEKSNGFATYTIEIAIPRRILRVSGRY
jgi:hypothetical protein